MPTFVHTNLNHTQMKRLFAVAFATCSLLAATVSASDVLLRSGWRFTKGDVADAATPQCDDSRWQAVCVPHDWAITGPFGSSNDLQNVAVTQNGEREATLKTGRTGGLPYVGVGWYRVKFKVESLELKDGHEAEGTRTYLLFDGAMSEARVYVNGKEAIFWPYGYNSFYVDVTDLLTTDSTPNLLAVRLENRDESSRWYPGAGLFRNVHVIRQPAIHPEIWGTQVFTRLTPTVVGNTTQASVEVRTSMVGAEGITLRFDTDIISPDGQVVVRKTNTQTIAHGQPFVQHFNIERPQLWSPESPVLYRAVTHITPLPKGKSSEAPSGTVGEVSTGTIHTTTFGIRTIELVPDRGFFLNGQHRKFQGVCNHHDLGPLGAAVNRAALRRQLTLLKDMGCDAIRTSHNMPAPELVELCDSMGFMMMVEPFDEWDIAKCRNGYHRYFKEWAEKDMINMVRHYRNHPSVVMWSVGNEVPTQCSPQGYQVAKFLQDICHREDPTRPVTCGMDQVTCVLGNGFAAMLDVPGFNYRADRYEEAYAKLPQGIVLGSETASTVSSRGVYKFPVELKAGAKYPDHQSSGYDVESCWWSNVPEVDFANADDQPWEIGQFVWTGFDYLGEPTPYDTDAWPSHSSLFGIIDLASLPKDRFYLYRSVWNRRDHTLHIVPHWTWPGREGEVTPVFVYTDAPEAELFVNGKSQGVKHKYSREESAAAKQAGDPFWLLRRYRLIWDQVKYEPGEVKAVAHYPSRAGGASPATNTSVVRTAGRPHHIRLEADRTQLSADGDDLAYVTVSVVDKDDNLCPFDSTLISFRVKGAGRFRAAANGDATNLDLFHLPRHHAFAGQLTAIVQSADKPGTITLEATGRGLKKGTLTLTTKATTQE